MATAVVYYSLTGNTEAVARDEARRREADLFEVAQVHPGGILGALVKGCPAAFLQKSFPLVGAPLDLSPYDAVVIAAPVWAGFPAPAFNTIADMVPVGKKVEVLLVSDSGDTARAKDKIVCALEARGLAVAAYTDKKA